jgi:hypothetical protein
MGMMKCIRFFEDTDDADMRQAFDAVDREWRSLWPTGIPVPPSRFCGRPVACTRDKKTGELKRGATPVVPMVSVWRRPYVRSNMSDVPIVGEHVDEVCHLPGPLWVIEGQSEPMSKAS